MGSLRAIACGWTTHGVHQLLRGAPRERRVFPANAFLYEDGERRVLFDTGYAPFPWRTGLAGWAYRRLLPPTVPAGASIGEQLDADTVTHVVLSHLHPDHIGGLGAFPHATVVVTEAVRRTIASPTLRAGVLDGLLPTGLAPRLQVVPETAFRTRGTDAATDTSATAALRTADLFGDGAYRLVDLPGHAAGHVGALVEGRVLLSGDAAWGRDLLGEEHRIRAVPRAVAHDSVAQAATARLLLDVERQGVRLLFSHDDHATDVDLLSSDDAADDDPADHAADDEPAAHAADDDSADHPADEGGPS